VAAICFHCLLQQKPAFMVWVRIACISFIVSPFFPQHSSFYCAASLVCTFLVFKHLSFPCITLLSHGCNWKHIWIECRMDGCAHGSVCSSIYLLLIMFRFQSCYLLSAHDRVLRSKLCCISHKNEKVALNVTLFLGPPTSIQYV